MTFLPEAGGKRLGVTTREEDRTGRGRSNGATTPLYLAVPYYSYKVVT
jgi:hypothetical protein